MLHPGLQLPDPQRKAGGDLRRPGAMLDLKARRQGLETQIPLLHAGECAASAGGRDMTPMAAWLAASWKE